jgi:S-formylglutathione hydrolase FrmB
MRATHTGNWTGEAVFLLTAVVLTACATSQAPTGPDTPRQAKTRSDLEQCNAAGGGHAYTLTVSPEGKYSYQTTGTKIAQTILDCMTSKGYSVQRTDNLNYYPGEHLRPSGGKGEPSL